MWPTRIISRWTALLALVVIAGPSVLAPGGRDPTRPPDRPGSSRAFRSAADPQAPAVVWAVGDGADGGPRARALGRRIAAARPDRLLYLGDVYYSGSAEDFAFRYGSAYGTLARRTAPTPGNHDWPLRRTGYDAWWRRVTGRRIPAWYVLRLGGWELISLNSEAAHGPDGAQVRWLRREVASAGTCRLAFWHRPRLSAGSHGDQPDTAPFWEALRGRATLVVSGHDHNLQRMAPIDGITQLIAGAGGRSHYPVSRDDRRLAFADDERDGALRIALRPGRAELSFVTRAGRVLDRSTVACRPGGS